MATAPRPSTGKKLIRYLGMEHIFELYGATEAAISTFRQARRPARQRGEAKDKRIVILDQRDRVCPPGEVDAQEGC